MYMIHIIILKKTEKASVFVQFDIFFYLLHIYILIALYINNKIGCFLHKKSKFYKFLQLLTDLYS